ncbi:hypothetical protein WA158_007330 [Blastocystis sp. Blastoise]
MNNRVSEDYPDLSEDTLVAYAYLILNKTKTSILFAIYSSSIDLDTFLQFETLRVLLEKIKNDPKARADLWDYVFTSLDFLKTKIYDPESYRFNQFICLHLAALGAMSSVEDRKVIQQLLHSIYRCAGNCKDSSLGFFLFCECILYAQDDSVILSRLWHTVTGYIFIYMSIWLQRALLKTTLAQFYTCLVGSVGRLPSSWEMVYHILDTFQKNELTKDIASVNFIAGDIPDLYKPYNSWLEYNHSWIHYLSPVDPKETIPCPESLDTLLKDTYYLPPQGVPVFKPFKYFEAHPELPLAQEYLSNPSAILTEAMPSLSDKAFVEPISIRAPGAVPEMDNDEVYKDVITVKKMLEGTINFTHYVPSKRLEPEAFEAFQEELDKSRGYKKLVTTRVDNDGLPYYVSAPIRPTGIASSMADSLRTSSLSASAPSALPINSLNKSGVVNPYVQTNTVKKWTSLLDPKEYVPTELDIAFEKAVNTVHEPLPSFESIKQKSKFYQSMHKQPDTVEGSSGSIVQSKGIQFTNTPSVVPTGTGTKPLNIPLKRIHYARGPNDSTYIINDDDDENNPDYSAFTNNNDSTSIRRPGIEFKDPLAAYRNGTHIIDYNSPRLTEIKPAVAPVTSIAPASVTTPVVVPASVTTPVVVSDVTTTPVVVPDVTTTPVVVPASVTTPVVVPASVTTPVVVSDVTTTPVVVPDVTTTPVVVPDVATSGAALSEVNINENVISSSSVPVAGSSLITPSDNSNYVKWNANSDEEESSVLYEGNANSDEEESSVLYEGNANSDEEESSVLYEGNANSDEEESSVLYEGNANSDEEESSVLYEGNANSDEEESSVLYEGNANSDEEESSVLYEGNANSDEEESSVLYEGNANSDEDVHNSDDVTGYTDNVNVEYVNNTSNEQVANEQEEGDYNDEQVTSEQEEEEEEEEEVTSEPVTSEQEEEEEVTDEKEEDANAVIAPIDSTSQEVVYPQETISNYENNGENSSFVIQNEDENVEQIGDQFNTDSSAEEIEEPDFSDENDDSNVPSNTSSRTGSPVTNTDVATGGINEDHSYENNDVAEEQECQEEEEVEEECNDDDEEEKEEEEECNEEEEQEECNDDEEEQEEQEECNDEEEEQEEECDQVPEAVSMDESTITQDNQYEDISVQDAPTTTIPIAVAASSPISKEIHDDNVVPSSTSIPTSFKPTPLVIPQHEDQSVMSVDTTPSSYSQATNSAEYPNVDAETIDYIRKSTPGLVVPNTDRGQEEPPLSPGHVSVSPIISNPNILIDTKKIYEEGDIDQLFDLPTSMDSPIVKARATPLSMQHSLSSSSLKLETPLNTPSTTPIHTPLNTPTPTEKDIHIDSNDAIGRDASRITPVNTTPITPITPTTPTSNTSTDTTTTTSTIPTSIPHPLSMNPSIQSTPSASPYPALAPFVRRPSSRPSTPKTPIMGSFIVAKPHEDSGSTTPIIALNKNTSNLKRIIRSQTPLIHSFTPQDPSSNNDTFLPPNSPGNHATSLNASITSGVPTPTAYRGIRPMTPKTGYLNHVGSSNDFGSPKNSSGMLRPSTPQLKSPYNLYSPQLNNSNNRPTTPSGYRIPSSPSIYTNLKRYPSPAPSPYMRASTPSYIPSHIYSSTNSNGNGYNSPAPLPPSTPNSHAYMNRVPGTPTSRYSPAPNSNVLSRLTQQDSNSVSVSSSPLFSYSFNSTSSPILKNIMNSPRIALTQSPSLAPTLNNTVIHYLDSPKPPSILDTINQPKEYDTIPDLDLQSDKEYHDPDEDNKKGLLPGLYSIPIFKRAKKPLSLCCRAFKRLLIILVALITVVVLIPITVMRNSSTMIDYVEHADYFPYRNSTLDLLHQIKAADTRTFGAYTPNDRNSIFRYMEYYERTHLFNFRWGVFPEIEQWDYDPMEVPERDRDQHVEVNANKVPGVEFIPDLTPEQLARMCEITSDLIFPFIHIDKQSKYRIEDMTIKKDADAIDVDDDDDVSSRARSSVSSETDSNKDEIIYDDKNGIDRLDLNNNDICLRWNVTEEVTEIEVPIDEEGNEIISTVCPIEEVAANTTVNAVTDTKHNITLSSNKTSSSNMTTINSILNAKNNRTSNITTPLSMKLPKKNINVKRLDPLYDDDEDEDNDVEYVPPFPTHKTKKEQNTRVIKNNIIPVTNSKKQRAVPEDIPTAVDESEQSIAITDSKQFTPITEGLPTAITDSQQCYPRTKKVIRIIKHYICIRNNMTAIATNDTTPSSMNETATTTTTPVTPPTITIPIMNDICPLSTLATVINPQCLYHVVVSNGALTLSLPEDQDPLYIMSIPTITTKCKDEMNIETESKAQRSPHSVPETNLPKEEEDIDVPSTSKTSSVVPNSPLTADEMKDTTVTTSSISPSDAHTTQNLEDKQYVNTLEEISTTRKPIVHGWIRSYHLWLSSFIHYLDSILCSILSCFFDVQFSDYSYYIDTTSIVGFFCYMIYFGSILYGIYLFFCSLYSHYHQFFMDHVTDRNLLVKIDAFFRYDTNQYIYYDEDSGCYRDVFGKETTFGCERPAEYNLEYHDTWYNTVSDISDISDNTDDEMERIMNM